jgi:hypothetical protein
MTEKEQTEKEKREKLLEELYKEYPIDEMVRFSELDIAEKLQDNTYWVVKFRDLFFQAQADYEHLEDLLEKLIGQRYDHYRFHSDKELDKTEIKAYYLPQDSQILRMKKILARQKIKVEFFKMCVNGMEKQQWNMKNFLEALKGHV